MKRWRVETQIDMEFSLFVRMEALSDGVWVRHTPIRPCPGHLDPIRRGPKYVQAIAPNLSQAIHAAVINLSWVGSEDG
jgi:hypothetical protein